MSSVRKFILIDDDPLNNLLCKIELETTLGEVDIQTFLVPEKGLEYIQKEYDKIMPPTILLLDINMPTLTGWEFMEAYEKFDEQIKKQLTIYILSSSVDQRDKDKAKANKYIKGFLIKSLEQETIGSIAGL